MRPISRKVSPSSERCVENTVPYASPHSIRAPSGDRTAPKSTVMLSPAGTFTAPLAQRGEPARLAHRGGLLGSVEVDFDDLRPALGRRILADPANEPRLDRGEGEDVLSALAVARAAEIGPRLSVERRSEAVVRRRALAPIDLEPAERRDRAEIDLEPRLVGRLRPSTPSRSCRRRRAEDRRCWRRRAIGAWAGLSSELPTPSVGPRRRTDKGGLRARRRGAAPARPSPPCRAFAGDRRRDKGVVSSQRRRDRPRPVICLGRQIG